MPAISQLIVDQQRFTWDEVLSPHVYVFYASFLTAFIFTPIMRSIAVYYGIIDQPDHLRKIHKLPVAYLGGVAVFLGWLVGLAVSQLHMVQVEARVGGHLQVKLSIIAGAAATVVLGLFDDIRRIGPWVKVLGQVIAALLLVSQSGIVDHCLGPIVSGLNLRLQVIGWQIPEYATVLSGKFFAICLVVACCNATNLMDGLDGLCGGVTAVIAAGFLFLAVHIATLGVNPNLDPLRVVLALALLGAVLGFVPYNFNPASIFMGDAGSMFLGYSCATLILILSQENTKWLLAALVMFALPILDTALAVARRWVNRRPIFSPDRHHFHHQLVARGLSIRKTVMISYGLAIGFCLLGAPIVYLPRVRYAIAFYLVIFGSIIVAAYKMGMVHEKPRVVSRVPLDDANLSAASPAPLEPASVIEVQESSSLTAESASETDT